MSLIEIPPTWLPAEATNPHLQKAWYYWRSFQGSPSYDLEENKKANSERFADIEKESQLFYYMLAVLTHVSAVRMAEAAATNDNQAATTAVVTVRLNLASVPVLDSMGPKLLEALDNENEIISECNHASTEFLALSKSLASKAETCPIKDQSSTAQREKPSAPSQTPPLAPSGPLAQRTQKPPARNWWEFWKSEKEIMSHEYFELFPIPQFSFSRSLINGGFNGARLYLPNYENETDLLQGATASFMCNLVNASLENCSLGLHGAHPRTWSLENRMLVYNYAMLVWTYMNNRLTEFGHNVSINIIELNAAKATYGIEVYKEAYCEKLKHDITQAEVDALVDQGRISNERLQKAIRMSGHPARQINSIIIENTDHMVFDGHGAFGMDKYGSAFGRNLTTFSKVSKALQQYEPDHSIFDEMQI